ncbi:hypothetical protein L6164_029502 [Bauhinia variegata]|uniref:Uncharacterized protein n=1 Tax=Bauhinia variegata TaxID=167791 RepID=A0ACB9L9Y3_BAUVA|nr:hypothetical protein L6164_029502 [Bauhinia variegata]
MLVVEKESVFQRLANDQSCNASRCVLITRRGYPDIPTRSKWPMTRKIFVSQRYNGLEIFLQILRDKKKIEAMLLRCYLQKKVPQWRLELVLMLQKGVKFEIEALSVPTLVRVLHTI